MLHVFPDYYNEFKCINSKCKHNCCIGWDIYIDNATAKKYKNIPGEFGARLKRSISFKEEPHFILENDKRCPFLNENNLCDIIINLGEEHLCDICKNHPRFINELPGRIETGIGLSCEEAARIILSKKEPTLFFNCENDSTDDELINKRQELFKILQNRKLPVFERLKEMLKNVGTRLPDISFGEWIDLFLSYERLDEKWTDILTLLKENYKTADYSGFGKYIENRQYEYEQLAVYLIYRYYANSFDLDDAAVICAFTVLICKLLYSIGAVIWTQTGCFSFEQQVELVRMFSAEIEYSDEIIDNILNELYN